MAQKPAESNVISDTIRQAVEEEVKRLNLHNPAASKSPEKTKTHECPECGGKVREGAPKCRFCGVELEWADDDED